MSESQISKQFEFPNRGTVPLLLVVEPWGMELPIAPGNRLNVEVVSTEDGELEVERPREDVIIIWLWVGCRVRIVDADNEVYSTMDGPAVPGTGGQSVRDFIKLMFG